MTQDWTAKGTAGHEAHGQWAVYDESGKDIAIVYDGKAHGHIISAAPDMLDALLDAQQEIENMLEDLCQAEGPEADTSANKTLATIQRAIAKARGQT